MYEYGVCLSSLRQVWNKGRPSLAVSYWSSQQQPSLYNCPAAPSTFFFASATHVRILWIHNPPRKFVVTERAEGSICLDYPPLILQQKPQQPHLLLLTATTMRCHFLNAKTTALGAKTTNVAQILMRKRQVD
jgi:hypothetical protein